LLSGGLDRCVGALDLAAIGRSPLAVRVLSVTTPPSAWYGTVALAEGTRHVRTALGLHPDIAHERKGELQLFVTLLADTRYVGEVGLDGAPEFKPYCPDQISVFSGVLGACERRGGRVLTVHSRRAATAVLDALEAHPKAGTAILHWFSGSQRELKRAIDLGCWFSVGPAMNRRQRGRSLVERMPHDRVLPESDGPFVQVNKRAALSLGIPVRS
jgi:TatD DNase family protein